MIFLRLRPRGGRRAKECTRMDVRIDRFATGPLETNTYVVSGNQDAALIVDPSSGCEQVKQFIEQRRLVVSAILLTHAHFDHLMGIEEIHAFAPGVDVWVHPADTLLLRDPEYNGSVLMGAPLRYEKETRDLHEGNMEVGGYALRVLHVPGHSPGGCAFVFGNQCLSGDSLFAGSIGRTDFPGCDGAALLKGIREKLFTLPDDTIVFPGHFGQTTIGQEKRLNPFLQ